MYEKKAICVDCGKEFTKYSVSQVRCHECQEVHRHKLWLKRYEEYKASKKTKKKLNGAVYINGHPQVCEYMKSCYYGSTKEDGCSYAIEHHKTRICNGLYIVDGKCPAYTAKGRRADRSKPPSFNYAEKPAEKASHNYCEV